MQRHSGQTGAALILLIGITAALAILSAAMVMLLGNQQGATARERQSKTSMYYAEAALNSALAAVKGSDKWQTEPFSDPADMTAMAAKYISLPDPRPTPTFRVYDNAATIDPVGYPPTPAWDQNGDGQVWVQATVTYQGRTTPVRQMVAFVTSSLPSKLAKAAIFCGAAGAAGANDNITFTGTGDAYTATFDSWPATNANGHSYTGGAPYPTAIKSVGNITATSSTKLALGGGTQSLGVQSNGTVSLPGVANNGSPSRIDGPADLYAYLGVNDQLALVTEASACLQQEWLDLMLTAKAADQRPAAVTGTAKTSKTALLAAMTKVGNVYTATSDLIYTSSTTLQLNDAGTTYNFKSLTVNGNVALSSTTTTTFTGGLRVTGTLGISSTGTANVFGPVYAVGTTTISGSSSNTFGPLWVDGGLTLSGSGVTKATTSLHVGGAFAINSTASITNEFGPTYVVGATTISGSTTNKFQALWMDGNFTLNGSTTTEATALHVGGAFAISGPTSTNKFGCVYVVGNVDWGGAASVQTTNYLDAASEPGPMWIGGVFTRNGGPFNDVYGQTFIVFKVNFTPTSGQSTVLCPILATTEMVTTSGAVDFGTMVVDAAHPDPRPMVLYTIVDDIYYTQTVNWGSTGQFTGLMILLEQGINISNGNPTKPAVVGSVQSIGGDGGVSIGGSAEVAYCQDVIDAVCGTMTATTTITQTVPGTWQELSPSGQ
jgi:hypothetical protein